MSWRVQHLKAWGPWTAIPDGIRVPPCGEASYMEHWPNWSDLFILMFNAETDACSIEVRAARFQGCPSPAFNFCALLSSPLSGLAAFLPDVSCYSYSRALHILRVQLFSI